MGEIESKRSLQCGEDSDVCCGSEQVPLSRSSFAERRCYRHHSDAQFMSREAVLPYAPVVFMSR